MAILFFILLGRGNVPQGLGQVADGLLSNLSLLFVPAGAGVMLHFSLLGRDWLPLAVGVLGSTMVTVAAVSVLMAKLTGQADRRPAIEPDHD
jgi:putative effector of murein hydrolase LrgA (UPF0299 family)